MFKTLIKSVLGTIILATALQASVLLKEDNFIENYSIPVYFANSEVIASEVKSAIYYSINNKGKIIDFENINLNSFEEDYVLIQSITGNEFYSHLTIYFKNGKKSSFKIMGDELTPLS